MKSSCLVPAFPNGVWAAQLQASGLRDSATRQSPMVFAAKCRAVYGCLCQVQGKPTSLKYCLLSVRNLWLILSAHLHQEPWVTLTSAFLFRNEGLEQNQNYQ